MAYTVGCDHLEIDISPLAIHVCKGKRSHDGDNPKGSIEPYD